MPPGLIEILSTQLTNDLSGEDFNDQDKIRQDRLHKVIKRLQADEPYNDLPKADREAIISIKTSMDKTIDPEISGPLIANLTNIVIDKNNEIAQYRGKTWFANKLSILSGLIALASAPAAFRTIVKWLRSLWALLRKKPITDRQAE